ncbi:hypothetical protein [Persicobacter psychrovividus]|uniref:Uncharacterized protein n=1 Tax=Persicobacter psychrovividus TaxID=387638 RepID=A0ABN6L530_9BACT|nr:hypothetical protein PEPS_04800 [Persicobacter psychrovividus]
MLKYCKTILSKVSFDAHLFKKELIKAIKFCMPVERLELQNWCYQQFGDQYNKILNEAFG